MPMEQVNDCQGCKIASLCSHSDGGHDCPKGWGAVMVFALPLLALIALSIIFKS